MSNSNYSIGLQSLKPVHTGYCGLHNLAENWSWARDVNGRDRDVCLPRPKRWQFFSRRDRDETLLRLETETTTLQFTVTSWRVRPYSSLTLTIKTSVSYRLLKSPSILNCYVHIWYAYIECIHAYTFSVREQAQRDRMWHAATRRWM